MLQYFCLVFSSGWLVKKEAAKREVEEEAGVTVEDVEKMGIVDFEFKDDPKILETHLFKAIDFTGEPRETEEMRPQWFSVDEIPFRDMWSDDLYWMPLLLKGRKFRGRFLFDQPSTAEYQAKILEHELKEVEEI